MPAKKPISLRPQAVKTAIHLQSTKINKNPFVTQRVFLHTLFLEYATETGGNKCKAVLYTYKQIGMRSLELFWPCSILAKNLGDVLARSLSHQGLKAFEARPRSALRPGVKGLQALLIEGLRAKRAYIAFLADFHFLQDRANFWQTDLF